MTKDKRKTRPAGWICGGEEHAGVSGCPLDHRFDTCPNAASHAPMPDAYSAWHAVAEMRTKAHQRSERCPGCGLFTLAIGGRPVIGWPRTMSEVPA